MARRRFTRRGWQEAYDLARRMGNDRSSTFYNSDGSQHTGAGHRCAYWAGRNGTPSTYSDRNCNAYPYYAAGVDDRVEIDKLERGPTWQEYTTKRRVA